ncbi:MAG: FAD-dependent oxidoreductase [Methanosarcinaceae archaeon]|nr:FAD-dependent oxidoreductase [Methanosarcinaceae archaeon]
MQAPQKKTAVFLCHCSGNISDRINLRFLKKALKAEGISVFDFEYLCSREGQTLIKDKIFQNSIDRVVIGSCTPFKHERLFKKCVKEAGLNPAMLEIANLREQCAWVHPKPSEATKKALSILKGKIRRLEKAKVLKSVKVNIRQKALVLGGGIAGIATALSLAENGILVYLVEKETSIGGQMAKIGKIFSPDKLAEECAMCSLSPLMNEILSHPKISLFTSAEIESLSGSSGNFKVKVRQNPRYVQASCVACGKCSTVCPVLVENEFNCGYKDKKAISLRFSQSVPKIYAIDPVHCLELGGKKEEKLGKKEQKQARSPDKKPPENQSCGKCVEACKVGAIDLKQQPEFFELEVGAIVVATGFEEYDCSQKPQYGYGLFENVLTQTELARMLGLNGPTKGKLRKPSDNKETVRAPETPKKIVMIQCVGSRDEKTGGKPYCSRYCCMAALKHANLIRKKYPETEITICYIDIRAFGLYENYYRAVQNMGVHFLRGRPAEVIEKANKSLIVRVEDTLKQELVELPADLVVLSAAMVPSKGTLKLAKTLNLSQDENGFLKEKHSKLKPVDSSVEGIFVCGTAQAPKDITDTIAQAGLAAARARIYITDSPRTLDHELVDVNPLLCTGCGKCLSCPFEALSLNERGKIDIDPLLCTGCGYCVNHCEKKALQIRGFTAPELHSEIDGILEEGDLLVFINSGIAYLTCDNIGNSVLSYPAKVKPIKVPTNLLLSLELLEFAFEKGAKAVLMLEDAPDNPKAELLHPFTLEHFEKLKTELGENGKRLFFKKAYVPNTKGLAKAFALLAEGELPG